MAESVLRERLSLVRGPGGRRALAYWLLRQVGRLDVYTVYALALHSSPTTVGERGSSDFVVLRGPDDLEGQTPSLVQALDAQSGCGVAATIHHGGRIYALVRGDEVLSQLKIEIGGGNVDTPTKLRIDVGTDNAFLSFLFTSGAARRSGWAKRLISMTCAKLAAEGLRHCVCHVQATNLRSRSTFESLGWEAAGWLVASAGGKPLGIHRNPLARFDRLELGARPWGELDPPAGGVA